jgi:NitT/TauT family transport system substrate-binding protein
MPHRFVRGSRGQRAPGGRRGSRRQFVQRLAKVGLSTVALTLLGGCANRAPIGLPGPSGERLETTRIRLVKIPASCIAAEYVAEDLLRAEGFTDVGYVQQAGTVGKGQAVASGEADLTLHFVAPMISQIEAGDPIVILGGVHVGCFQLFGTDRVQAVRDLKGKSVAIPEVASSAHVFLASMAAAVGLTQQDINWETHPSDVSMQRLADGQVDAFLGFPPEPQQLLAHKVGHVVVNSAVDRPWSQYFCCMLVGNREFVSKNPVATRRAALAIYKAADICATQPEQAGQLLFDRGYVTDRDYAVQLVKDLPYDRWREYDPEDTVRYYSLRLQEAGMIKSSPATIIERGTDWRMLNELKKELKA